MFDDFYGLIILAVVLSVLTFIAKIVWIGFIAKKAFDLYAAQAAAARESYRELERLSSQFGDTTWASLLNAASQMNAAIQERARQPNSTPPIALTTQFRTGWSRAQLELDRMHDLRREQAELRLAQMKGDAASMGLFL